MTIFGGDTMAKHCLISYQQLHHLSPVTPVKFAYFTGDRYLPVRFTVQSLGFGDLPTGIKIVMYQQVQVTSHGNASLAHHGNGTQSVNNNLGHKFAEVPVA